MQSAFGVLVVIVVVGAAVVGVITLLMTPATWEEFGSRGLLMDRDTAAPRPAGHRGSDAERDEEIRQMLEAGNARRLRRGEAPLDVDAELARLTASPGIDAELRQEIRDLVIARNHRRARRGEPPLDVDAEVEREISALSG